MKKKIQQAICFYPFNADGILMESSEDHNNFFSKIISRITETVNKITTKISEIFQSKSQDTKIKEIETKIKEDPSVGKKEVEITDYEALQKLNKQTSTEIMNAKTTEELEEKMKKYRSQRNKILGAASLVTVSLSTALHFITKGKNAKIKDLTDQRDEAVKNIEKLKTGNQRLQKAYSAKKQENEKLKDELEMAKAKTLKDKASVAMKQTGKKVDNVVTNVSNDITLAKQKASMQTEIVSNASKDVISNVKDVVASLMDPSNGTVKKVSETVKGIAKSVSDVKKAADGTDKEELKANRKEELKEKIEKLTKSLQKAKNVLNDKSAPREKRMQAREYINKHSKTLENLKVQYRGLK